MHTDFAPVLEWLKAFARAVRDRDYEAGRALCLPEVLGFGTVAGRASGIDALVARQWEPIWAHTRGFDFEYDTATGAIDDRLAWVAVRWRSQRPRTGGEPITRTGRATIVLRRTGSAWKACHTHFSRTPSEIRSDDPRA